MTPIVLDEHLLEVPTAAIGIEGRHVWDGTFTLNDLSVYPRYHVRRISGLHSRADFAAAADALPGRLGELPRRALKLGKTVTYEGAVEAQTLLSLRQSIRAFQGAFTDDVERVMEVSQHPGYGLEAFTFTALPVLLEIPDEQLAPPRRHTRGYERPFALGLRLSDPRLYGVDEVVAQGAGDTTHVVDNEGTAPTDPVLEIHGPITNPRVQNFSLGASINLRFVTAIATGEYLRVEFGGRRLLLNGTVDASGALNTAQSEWWDAGVPGLRPGLNDLRLFGDNSTAATELKVRFRPAYWV